MFECHSATAATILTRNDPAPIPTSSVTGMYVLHPTETTRRGSSRSYSKDKLNTPSTKAISRLWGRKYTVALRIGCGEVKRKFAALIEILGRWRKLQASSQRSKSSFMRSLLVNTLSSSFPKGRHVVASRTSSDTSKRHCRRWRRGWREGGEVARIDGGAGVVVAGDLIGEAGDAVVAQMPAWSFWQA